MDFSNQNRSTTPPGEDAIKYLWDEYKLLQDKIDKVGDFHFRVKGWLVTLVTGFIAATYAAKAPPRVVALDLLLVVAFYLIDWYEKVVERSFISRLRELEVVLKSAAGVRIFEVKQPSALLQASPPKRPASPADALRLEKKRLGWFARWLFSHSDGAFYSLAVLMVVIATVLSALRPEPDAHLTPTGAKAVQSSAAPSESPRGETARPTGASEAAPGTRHEPGGAVTSERLPVTGTQALEPKRTKVPSKRDVSKATLSKRGSKDAARAP